MDNFRSIKAMIDMSSYSYTSQVIFSTLGESR